MFPATTAPRHRCRPLPLSLPSRPVPPAAVALRRRLLWLALLCAALACWRPCAALAADGTDEVERQVKIAYLYKFANFVEWPADAFAGPDSPFVIAVLEADALADQMESSMAGRMVGGRKVVVRKLRRVVADQAAPHVLLVGDLDARRLQEIWAALQRAPVLTVSQSSTPYGAGSMINFVEINDRLRFEVAPRLALQSRLRISALMLSAAYKVQKEGS